MFVGENCETEIPPAIQLAEPIQIAPRPIAIAPRPIAIDPKTELVLVSHDESVFAAHDGRRMVWMEDGKPPLRPKGNGQGLMVSQFLCPCHGRFSSQTIKIGANYDGYWTLETMAAHLKEAIPKFNELHPFKTALFLLDNSSNHNGFAEDALRATSSRVKWTDGFPARKSKKPRTIIMRNTEWVDSYGVLRTQNFHKKLESGKVVQKGVKYILMERGLWKPGMKAEEGLKILSEQPDFVKQMPHLIEIIANSGHLGIFLPKFHPEFNFIERFWGAAKLYLRQHCEYTFEALEKNIERALDSVPLKQIRKYCNHCWRYMIAYAENTLTPEQVEWAMKKFTSHRRVKPSECVDEFKFLELDVIRETIGRPRAVEKESKADLSR